MTARPYDVAFTGPAIRALRQLPEKVATAVVGLCYGTLAANPRRVRAGLRWELTCSSSARRGEYRAIYRSDEVHGRVEIVAIDHRADVYR